MKALEEEVQDAALLDIFRTLRMVRDWGALQDIVYLSQQTGALPQTFDFDVRHVRPGEYVSSAVTYTLNRLEARGKVRDVQTGRGTSNLHLDESEISDPAHIGAGIVAAIGELKPEDVSHVARVAYFADKLKIDFTKPRLTKAEIKRLRGPLAYPDHWITISHAAYRRILGSK